MSAPGDVTVLLVCGSLRTGSTNAAVLDTAAAVAPPGVATRRDDALLGRLPHFNPDDDVEPLPAPVRALRDALGAADAVLFCTPEYAGALPGSLKNLLDWAVGGGELDRKPVAWINAAGPAAPAGGADAHASLRKVLGYTGSAIVEDACARIPVTRGDVGADGLTSPALRAQVANAVAALAAVARGA